MSRRVTESTKKNIAGRQKYKCANFPKSNLNRLSEYNCSLWANPILNGNFDESGYEIDHIDEFCNSKNDNLDNLQALCIMCHRVKTKSFNRTRNLKIKDHPIFGKLIISNGNRNTYLSSSKKIFIKSKIWSKNRPVDMQRVCEIASYINKHESKIIDGIIYLANIEKEGIVCYDGNHRRSSIEFLKEDKNVMVDVIDKPSFKELKNIFMNLNKCVPISELYSNPDSFTIEQKNMINTIADSISNRWKSHKSNSPRPRKPNFNRELFVNDLTKMLRENGLVITQDKLLEAIDKLNTNYKNKYINSSIITQKTKDKCVKNDCYLFLGSLSNLTEFI